MLYGPEYNIPIGSSVEYGQCTDGVNTWFAWVNGSGLVVVLKSTNQMYDFPAIASAVTVNNDPINTAVMLNEPFVRDPITGVLHICWERNGSTPGSVCKLAYSRSTDGGATWSAAILLEDGSTHGTNRFHRLGITAYNGVVAVVYTSESASTFTTDGLYFVQSTDGGVTWSAEAKLYNTPVCPFEPNTALGDDGSIFVSIYDPGVLANQGGDIYFARGVWNAAGFIFQPALTRVTNGQTCGRTRVCSSRGTVLICTNTNWGGSIADVSTVLSQDNGATWGAVVLQASHGAGPLTHPWAELSSDTALLFWCDTSPNPSPSVYGNKISLDRGVTWNAGPAPMTTTLATADAPKVLFMNDIATTIGVDATGNIIYSVLPLFSPTPAITPVVDNFIRADENPLSKSGVWAQEVIAGTPLKLVSNVAVRQAASGVFGRSGSFRNDITVSAGEAYVSINTNGGADGELDLYLMQQATKNGYTVQVKNNIGSTALFLNREDAAAATQLATNPNFGAITGDKYNLRLTPNDVVVHRFVGASGDWMELFRERDTTYRVNSLAPAVDLVGLNGEPAIDVFGSGTLLAPSNTVAPSIVGRATLNVNPGTWSVLQGATPTRYSYQWQSSPHGANVWTNISLAALVFLIIPDNTLDYRCVVTGSNSYGTTSANSNISAPPVVSAIKNRPHFVGVGIGI